jgi:DNA-binding transcriptional MerR regulator
VSEAPIFTAPELCRTLGISSRTLRNWITSGILERPDFHGRSTFYTAEDVRRGRAALAMRGRKRPPLSTLAKRLNGLTSGELEALATGRKIATPTHVPEPPRAPSYPAERWEHVVLAPGLELRVLESAPPIYKRIVDEIYRHYGQAQGARRSE